MRVWPGTISSTSSVTALMNCRKFLKSAFKSAFVSLQATLLQHVLVMNGDKTSDTAFIVMFGRKCLLPVRSFRT